jgi:hypothetical protein
VDGIVMDHLNSVMLHGLLTAPMAQMKASIHVAILMIVLLAALMMSLHVMMVLAYQVVGNVMYTGVIVVIALMKPIAVVMMAVTV